MNTDDFKYLLSFAKDFEIDDKRYSCLGIAIRDARKISGSDVSTGEMKYDVLESENNVLSIYSFIGIINYLLILELIGLVFKKVNYSTYKTNPIYKCLDQFSAQSEMDIYVMIALRNCLAHNYGLANIPLNPKEYVNKRHLFSLDNSDSAPLIKYPKNPWNGSYRSKKEENYTVIGTHQLFEMVNNTYNCLLIELENNNVVLALSGGIDELKTRFTIIQ